MSSKVHVTLCVRTPRDKSPPARFCGHRHCGNEDIMFVVVEEKIPHCSRLNPPLLFIVKVHGMLCSQTLKFTIKRTLTITFSSECNEISSILVTRFLGNKLLTLPVHYRNTDEEGEKKETTEQKENNSRSNFKAFRVTRKRIKADVTKFGFMDFN